MYNIDRWAAYTKQRYRIKDVYRYDSHWCVMTPRQIRRCAKKGRKRNDQSIGLFS